MAVSINVDGREDFRSHVWNLFYSVYIKGCLTDLKMESLRGYADKKAVGFLVENDLMQPLDSQILETDKGRALANNIEGQLFQQGARLFLDSFPKE
jgi:hypothetical protein